MHVSCISSPVNSLKAWAANHSKLTKKAKFTINRLMGGAQLHQPPLASALDRGQQQTAGEKIFV